MDSARKHIPRHTHFPFQYDDTKIYPERTKQQENQTEEKEQKKKWRTHSIDGALQVLCGSISEEDQQESDAQDINVPGITSLRRG